MSQARWTAVDGYFAKTLLGDDAALRHALRASRQAGLPAINVSPMQGQLLHLLARIQGARRILEIGTLGGYSTIWMARALPKGGLLTSLEVDPNCARVAKANIKNAGLSRVVDILLGPALDTLPILASEKARFDMVFIDANKEAYPEYLRWAVRLAAPGCLIVADNVVREGEVVNARSRDPRVRAVRTMLKDIAADPRLTTTAIQTVGAKGYDGFALMIVNPRRSSSRRAS